VTVVRILAASLPIAVGVLVTVAGVLALRQRLPRNRYLGVRTSATLRDDTAFAVGNRVAGLPVAVAGAVGVLGGVLALLMPTTGGGVVAAAIGLVGLVAIASAGGALGHRAAQTVPKQAPAGCAGCQCGGCGVTASSA
jgi:uncharacterized membrane protein